MPSVRLRQPLKRLAGDEGELVLEGGTVGELLAALEQAHPAARGWILDERGSLRRHINVWVNGAPADLSSKVGDQDRIDILPAISGGS